MIRAFIAVELPEAARRTLADLQNALRRDLSGVRWVRPEGIHLTLKFLGDIPEERVDAIGQALQAATQGQGPLTLAVKGLGVFPGIRKARVIWAGLGGETADLVALQQRVDAALEPLDFPRERRRFKAHLTLGRFKKTPPAPALVSILERRSDYPPCEVAMGRVVLYRSELRPQGARYSPLIQAPLEWKGA
jgi:2'-5' RNA ligase